jgi:hypothetical protein
LADVVAKVERQNSAPGCGLLDQPCLLLLDVAAAPRDVLQPAPHHLARQIRSPDLLGCDSEDFARLRRGDGRGSMPAAERSEFAEQLPRLDEVLVLVFAAGGASPGKQDVHSVRRIALTEQDLTGLEPANKASRPQPFGSRFSHCHSSTSARQLVDVIGGLPQR